MLIDGSPQQDCPHHTFPAHQPGFSDRLLATLPDLHIHQGYFLTKSYLCPFCGSIQETFEEKMTDVNIAVELLGDAQDDTFDTAIIISGDSDLYGPVNAIRQHYSDKRIVVAFPPNHVSKQLRQSANASFIIGRRMFSASLFQEQVPTPGGYVINKPPEWT